jgi:hypothetical protein
LFTITYNHQANSKWITNPNAYYSSGKPLLHELVINASNADLVRYLIEELGADVNVQSMNDSSDHTSTNDEASLADTISMARQKKQLHSRKLKKPLNPWIPQYPTGSTKPEDRMFGLGPSCKPQVTPLFEV